MVLVLWGLAALNGAAAAQPDWNARQIKWLDYQQGMQQAQQNDRPVLLLFYADWCPTCHAYKGIFYTPRVVALAKQFVMIRVNVDQQPQLDQRYQFDGGYVPRSFVLDRQGGVVQSLYGEKTRFKYFYKASDVAGFIALMERALQLE